MIEVIRYHIRHSAHVSLLEEGGDWNGETQGEPTGGDYKRLHWLRTMRRDLSEFCP
jgi:hypothetical protein